MGRKNVVDRVLDLIDERQNPCIVGLDPSMNQIPEHVRMEATDRYSDPFRAAGYALVQFSRSIIDAVAGIVPAVKLQAAFYEQYSSDGVRALLETVEYAKDRGLIVIEDAKKNDIGSTAKAYADGHLGKVEMADGTFLSSLDVDMMTINPYLGSDGIDPFVEVCNRFGKGVFILDKTSNPSSGELQDRLIEGKERIYEAVARRIHELGKDLIGERGYSSIGAVVGATYPDEAVKARRIMPQSIFLVPGYGAQGGEADDLFPCFNDDGYGALVNSSRGIIFAYLREPYLSEFSDKEFHLASRQAALDMRESVVKILKKHGKLPQGW